MNEFTETIKKLAQERQAVVLAHYYCRPEIYDLADFVGDSLGLALTAQKTSAKVIIFAGVHFMAETAAILCPDKVVVPVEIEAGCPMADMITAEALAEKKKEFPGVPVMTYVNSPASAKAESDICCTSANVAAVLRSLESKRVLMTPDRNLAAYAQRLAPDKEVLAWPGCCPIHDQLRAEEVAALKAEHPQARVLAHPECRPEVLALADQISSTSGILDCCAKSSAREFIVLTEEGLRYPLERDNPGKEFFFPEKTALCCRDMKINAREGLLRALETLEPVVRVPEPIAGRALRPIERMLAVPRDK